MAQSIVASVGENGVNQPEDVKVIQSLLNQVPPTLGGPTLPLKVDGFIGPKTIGAIRQFQQFQLGFQDGRVDPGGKTLAKLNEFAVTIEFLDATSALVDAVDFGLWDHAFERVGTPTRPRGVLFNDIAEADNFIGADSRRFYVRISDKAATGVKKIQANWHTLWPGGAIMDPLAGGPSAAITLLEDTPGVFKSQALILVNDDWELNHTTPLSGLPGDIIPRTRGMPDFRLRLGTMFGSVVVENGSGTSQAHRKEIPVFKRNPEHRRHLPVQIFVLKNIGSELDSKHIVDYVFQRDLPFIRLIYERLGLWVWTAVAPGTPAGDQRTQGKDTIVLIDSSGIDINNVTEDMEKTLAEKHLGLSVHGEILSEMRPDGTPTDTIRIFYVGALANKRAGETYIDADFHHDPRRGASFVAVSTAASAWDTSAAAHEIGHTLTDKVGGEGGHFSEPTAPSNHRFLAVANLMKPNSVSQVIDPTKLSYPGRLWDVDEPETKPGTSTHYNQYRDIRSSRYTRDF